MTRAAVALATGCSRVHLWRLEHGKIREDTKAGQRVRTFLGGSASLDAEFERALRGIVRDDPERRIKLLQMLRALSDLSEGPPADRPSRAIPRGRKAS